MTAIHPFSDPALVAGYAERTPRMVPGLVDLHRMAMLLLVQKAPGPAHILVVGAGGGLELKAFAEAQASWRLTGVDPSAAMIDLAAQVLGPLRSRADLVTGYVDSAPPGPFDGATCLLTLHFLTRDERLQMLHDIHHRLKPGARLVVAHHSVPQSDDPVAWLELSAAFASGPGVDFVQARASAETMVKHLHLLSTDEEVAILHDAGFSDVALFYAALSFRGWVASA